MALSYGFYNSVDGDRTYDAIQFGQIFDGIIKDGVYGTYLKGMVVIASENAGEVIIQPGRAWFNHTWSYNDANLVMQAPAPEVLLDRIDALVLDIASDLASRENSFKWVTGEPSSNPKRPTLTNTVTHHQYPLCYVRRYPETTMIYARDITNMVGTSECPFATGVLEGIDLDAWIKQWDDEFHTWEDATKVSFEGWMVTQQDVYTTWYNAIKNQMEGDLTDFEDWFERIKGIIDEEAATHLQSEIDALAAMLPAGSHITISTSETSLYLRNVTVSDGVHEATAKFDNSGVAVVESFPYVGLLTITSTDGQFTASTTLNTPYFGRYSASLSFWGATVNLDGDETLGGYTVTVKNSLDVPVISIVLNASGKGVFNATYPDTYKFVWTYGGDEMQVSLNVTEEKTYSVEIYTGFNWRRWCELGGVSTYGMTSLQDVFNDEQATRKLMTVHASADYLIDRVSHNINDLDEFTVNDTAMKWLGLRDYVCDGLTAISGVWAKFLASEYWERILKDHVPKMTSNTAPYGTVVPAANNSTYPAYTIFDMDDTTGGAIHSSGVPQSTKSRVYYQFVNPISVRKVRILSNGASTGIIQYSDDGTTWNDASSEQSFSSMVEKFVSIDEQGHHRYWALYVTSYGSGSTVRRYNCIQFYGRSINVSVPTMTSNTAPYGEASASSIQSGSDDAYEAFDSITGQGWVSTQTTDAWIAYDFDKNVKVTKVNIVPYNASDGVRVKDFIVQGYDGSDWIDIYEGTIPSNGGGANNYYSFTNNVAYSKYRLFVKNNYSNKNGYIIVNELQFYGVDYSEREFASGSTMKYLYDHGVELETFTESLTGTAGTTQKADSYMEIAIANKSENRGASLYAELDVTNYDLMRMKVADELYTSGTGNVMSFGANSALPIWSSGRVASKSFAPADTGLPNNLALDISSVTGSNYINIAVQASSGSSINQKGTVSEIWLE